jgi:hypothetical protein
MGQRVTDKFEHMRQGLWNAMEQSAAAPAIGYEMYGKFKGQPNQLQEMIPRAAMTFATSLGGEADEGQAAAATQPAEQAATAESAAPSSMADRAAEVAKRRISHLPGVQAAKDASYILRGPAAEAPEAEAAIPETNGIQWGTGGQGPLDLRGKMIPQTAAPAASSEVSDVASALKNTFGSKITQEDAAARAAQAVAKHPGDFDGAFREATASETPQVKQPAPIAKPVATPVKLDMSTAKPIAPETFERTLATANKPEVMGAPDLGPPGVQLPKSPAPEVGTPEDLAETRNIQDAVRNQAEREAMLEDVRQRRSFREGNAVEQGKWANVATARTGSDVTARVPYPRFTEGLDEIDLHPFTGAAAQPVPPEDLVPILEKSLKAAKKMLAQKNRLLVQP